ncbi:hypothetical protein GWI33_022672 [Rhynchophorus ferrugineus]|uniref:Uncharacterized protein n=1 Tax=Rhynchophorus ferrugineus TaxID=354439 RepID=A0A834MHQ9_RHYFE|nr:hypothetical protein GWI33_022672 [Rhynchophorus ferrugineus]
MALHNKVQIILFKRTLRIRPSNFMRRRRSRFTRSLRSGLTPPHPPPDDLPWIPPCKFETKTGTEITATMERRSAGIKFH